LPVESIIAALDQIFIFVDKSLSNS